jgi:hypothetical protein
MVKEQQRRIEDVDFKSLATGRKRKWDARVTAEGTWNMLLTENKKAPWLVYVCVLENGKIIPASTPAKEAVKLIDDSPAVGFVGCLRVNQGTLQFFTRTLKVRPEHQRLLDDVVTTLRTWAEDALGAALKGTLTKQMGDKK